MKILEFSNVKMQHTFFFLRILYDLANLENFYATEE